VISQSLYQHSDARSWFLVARTSVGQQ